MHCVVVNYTITMHYIELHCASLLHLPVHYKSALLTQPLCTVTAHHRMILSACVHRPIMWSGKLLYLALAIVAKMKKFRTAAQQTRWRERLADDNYCKQETSVNNFIPSQNLIPICYQRGYPV